MQEPRYPLPRVIQWGHGRNSSLLHAARSSDDNVCVPWRSPRRGLVIRPRRHPTEGGSTSGRCRHEDRLAFVDAFAVVLIDGSRQ
ncbi:hypothetical protein GW17_00033821 [Ensete ventricosum]|nr:hypothetical protein GW17_00033821 [Ensete ventricosum]